MTTTFHQNMNALQGLEGKKCPQGVSRPWKVIIFLLLSKYFYHCKQHQVVAYLKKNLTATHNSNTRETA